MAIDTTKTIGSAPLDASRLHVRLNKQPQPVGWLSGDPSTFQTAGTDHMLTVRWHVSTGWADPEIIPFGDLHIPPTASCLHYATQCFEGLKVYRGYDGGLRLFRPERNCRRLNTSAIAASLPSFDHQELEKLFVALLAIDGPKWLPKDQGAGKALYIRPALIADGPGIGVGVPETALLFVIIVPWVETSQSLLNSGLSLTTSRTGSIRAWPGGNGSNKLGANYGPTFVSLGEARALGFDQVLYLLGDNGSVTEAGGSNFFVVWKTPEGQTELVTAWLNDKVILPGVTRDSILGLAREGLVNGFDGQEGLPPLNVVERAFYMSEIAKAAVEGRLIEAFVAGTAYFVSPVSRIQWNDQSIAIPMPQPTSQSYALSLRTRLSEIMYGIIPNHPWTVQIEERGA